MDILHKSVGVDFEVKSDSAETGIFKGYASTFGNIDRDNDVIVQGAFGVINNAKSVKLLWQHQQSEPIGIWTKLVEDKKGLYAEGRLALKTRRGAEAYELMKMGALSDMSIGFKTIDSEPATAKSASGTSRRVRKIKRVQLFEVSLVSIPANELANVDAVKGVKNTVASERNQLLARLGLAASFDPEDLMTDRDFERRLRDAGLSRKMAQVIVAEGISGIEGYLETMLREAAGFSCKSAQIIVGGGYRAFVAKAKRDEDPAEIDAKSKADEDDDTTLTLVEDSTSLDDDQAGAGKSAETKADETSDEVKAAVTAGDKSTGSDGVHLRDADAEAKPSGSELAFDLSFLSEINAEVQAISGARNT